MEDLVEEREDFMVFPSENRVSPQTSNTKDRKRTKLSVSSSPAMEDLVEEREDFMVLPSENSRPSSSTHVLKPCFTASPDLNALSLSVSFNGWRFPYAKFKSWAIKMCSLHKPTWKKAGIFEAIVASTIKISKESDLVLCIAEKWCPDTNTFVFPWGEATITLEDVMVLLGFSVLGLPVFAALDSSGEKTKEKLEKQRLVLQKDQGRMVTQVVWMRRFMDSGDELEHVAFLALWLSYFVFSSRYYLINEAVFSVAVHLSSGSRVALAPAVLANLYADLSLLKDHTRGFTTWNYIEKIDMNALFKLVQVWTWERFKELQPKPNFLFEGQLRLARWDDVEQGNIDVRQVLDNSKSFEWRPYTKAVKNWVLPKFYPESAMWVPVGPDLDEEFISFARCIKVSELVGINSVEHYFPNRVALQFGLLQDVPSTVNRSNLSREEAWLDYNKPVEELALLIPSRSAVPRVTSMFCEWWTKTFPQLEHSLKEKAGVEASGTLKSRNIIGDDDTSASGSRKRKCKKRVCTMGHCQTHGNDEDLSLTIAKISRLSNKNCSDVTYSGEAASESRGKKSRFEADNNDSSLHQELGSIRANESETVPPPEIEQRNEDNDETGSNTEKNLIRSPIGENNSSNPPLGFDDATDILVSPPPPETRQTCDDELDVYGSNVEKMTMPHDASKELECLLQENSAMAGEKASSEKKEDDAVDDDSLIKKKLASNADKNEPGESNSGNAVGDGTQGHDGLFHDTALRSEETVKPSEELENLEKRNEDAGNDSYKKILQNLKELALSIDERIIKAQRNVAWLKARKATKQRKFAAAARLI